MVLKGFCEKSLKGKLINKEAFCIEGQLKRQFHEIFFLRTNAFQKFLAWGAGIIQCSKNGDKIDKIGQLFEKKFFVKFFL